MKHSAPSIESLQNMVDVSRETYDQLIIYYDLLLKWQKKINLVSPATIENAWQRHFLDSAQIFPLLKNKNARIFDFGSGAGFPGLVLSILGMTNMHLIESDQRKSIFQQEVIRQTESNAIVHNTRIEQLDAPQAEVITSRALASLDQLFTLSAPHLKEGGMLLFLKGKSFEEEVVQAQKNWGFEVEAIPSQTAPDAFILQCSNISQFS